MLIDIHNHPYWEGYDLERFVADMDEQNIDKVWIFGWECPLDEMDNFYKQKKYTDKGVSIPYRISKQFRDAYPNRFVLGYAPDFRLPDSFDKFKAAVENDNVKVLAEVKLRTCYDTPDSIKLFRYCGEHGIPVILDYNYPVMPMIEGRCYPRNNWWYGGGIDDLERVLQKCPETIILGHDAGFWAHISDDEQYLTHRIPKGPVKRGGEIVRLLEKYDNLYCDTSGPGIPALKRDPEYSAEFLTAYQDRVLFGRDCVGGGFYAFTESLKLDDITREKFYFKNALKLIQEG